MPRCLKYFGVKRNVGPRNGRRLPFGKIQRLRGNLVLKVKNTITLFCRCVSVQFKFLKLLALNVISAFDGRFSPPDSGFSFSSFFACSQKQVMWNRSCICLASYLWQVNYETENLIIITNSYSTRACRIWHDYYVILPPRRIKGNLRRLADRYLPLPPSPSLYLSPLQELKCYKSWLM